MESMFVAVAFVLSVQDADFKDRLLATLPEDARVIVPVAFSADGRRAAYVEQRDGSCRVVCGPHQGKAFGALC